MRTIEELRRDRPRSRFARLSTAVMIAVVTWAWTSGAFDLGELGTERATRNLDRFLSEVRPYPLQGRSWDWGLAWEWFREQTADRLGPALLDTLALSIAAIVLAGLLALASSLPAARSLSRAEPYLPAPSRPSNAAHFAWRAVVWIVRSALIVLRAIPEYVWAFMILILVGPGAWPAVLALALHNTGILGKLFAEVLENADPRTPRALRALGATRLQIGLTSLVPVSLNRFLLFFFYRWETCVREATILGLLGLSGLGSYILQAQAAIRWDEMVLWTLMGSVLIVAGDLLSALARRTLRHSA